MPIRRLSGALALAAAALLTTGAAKPTPTSTAPGKIVKVEVPPAADRLVGSCVARDKRTCTEYEGAFAGTDPRTLCAQAAGTWSPDRCPAEGRVGTCTQREIGSDARVVLRTYAPATTDAARDACEKVARSVFMPR